MLDALRTARFWYLFLSVCSIGWLSNITTVHQLAHMVDSGFADLLAAWVVGATGLLRAFSSTLWGSLSDRFGREPIFTIGTVLCMAGIGCLAVLQAPGALGLLYGYAIGFGIGYGVHGSVQAAATADLFPAAPPGHHSGRPGTGLGHGRLRRCLAGRLLVRPPRRLSWRFRIDRPDLRPRLPGAVAGGAAPQPGCGDFSS